MVQRKLNESDFAYFREKFDFRDNGDVDNENSSVAVHGDKILAAIILDTGTRQSVKCASYPQTVSNENGHSQILLMYMADDACFCYLKDLLESLKTSLPGKVVFCNELETISTEDLIALGFNEHILGVSRTFYMKF